MAKRKSRKLTFKENLAALAAGAAIGGAILATVMPRDVKRSNVYVNHSGYVGINVGEEFGESLLDHVKYQLKGRAYVLVDGKKEHEYIGPIWAKDKYSKEERRELPTLTYLVEKIGGIEVSSCWQCDYPDTDARSTFNKIGGKAQVIYVVDSDRAISESNESDNVVRIDVTPELVYDLASRLDSYYYGRHTEAVRQGELEKKAKELELAGYTVSRR